MSANSWNEFLNPYIGDGWSWVFALLLVAVPPALKFLYSRVVSFSKNSPVGSPKSSRYWRSELDRRTAAFQKLSESPEGEARKIMQKRVIQAVNYVQAHDSRKRMGVGGVAQWWGLFSILLLGSLFLIILYALTSFDIFRVLSFVLVIGALLVEVVALLLTGEKNEKIEAFVRACEFGHEDEVRDDPWWVLRKYDEWVSKEYRWDKQLNKQRREKNREQKLNLSRGVKIKNSLIGVPGSPRARKIRSDIWTFDPNVAKEVPWG